MFSIFSFLKAIRERTRRKHIFVLITAISTDKMVGDFTFLLCAFLNILEFMQ